MVIEINVTARDLTEEDLKSNKTFGCCIAYGDGEGRQVIPQKISEAEKDIFDAIFQRIVFDRDYLIEWSNLPGAVRAKISIIPAVDYEPKRN